jgi:hypothetical protein
MKKTLIAGVVMALVSTGALAKRPTQPEPTPDLTPRVEALETVVDDLTITVGALSGTVESLETASQERAARIQDLEDALGYMQPSKGSAVVFVDATDKVIGAPYNTINDTSYMDAATVFVKVDGYNGAYVMYFDRAAQEFTPTGGLQYTDTTCGNDGGQAYMVVTDPLRPTEPVAEDLSGILFVPEPGVQPERRTMGSRISAGTCRSDGGLNNTVTVVPVEFNVEFPVRLEFR